ncbi:MAG: imidazole glycerol phosphate synthase subunit HisF [Candidatus Peribacteraceae bacterium]|nr:imidazole glycerol phosphate synthase subunit HisF [Candidatus Peribacteraceae bacterium]
MPSCPPIVGILQTASCNTGSIMRSLSRLGITSGIVRTRDDIDGIDGLIVPGAGAAKAAMDDLHSRNLIDVLRSFRKPLLGLCLGMQLLFDNSEEGPTECLGIIRGTVRALPDNVIKPHMGWNRLSTGEYAYFVHSFVCVPDDPRVITMTVRYGDDLCAGVRSKNFFGVQWHPEKSGIAGDSLLRSFAKLCSEPRPPSPGCEPEPQATVNPGEGSGEGAFRIIPAIDILDGTVVRLKQGDFDRVTLFETDPLALAKKFEADGAQALHLVNLCGAKSGRIDDAFITLVRSIASETSLSIQVGGGIRTLKDIARLLDAGADNVVLGTVILTDPGFLRAAIDLFGQNRILAALDTLDGIVRIRGWQETSAIPIDDACRSVQASRCSRILVTDIDKDGMERGPNVELYRKLSKSFPELSITASGGIGTPDDCRILADAGCTGAIVGKALVSEKRSFKEFSASSIRIISDSMPSVSCRINSAANGINTTKTLAIRIIPCLDIDNGRVVKGTAFQNLRDAGDPIELAKRYCAEGADELVFLDITATSDNRKTMIDLVSLVADAVNIPFTVGGGVRSVNDARALLNAGADKVAVNSAAVRNPTLLSAMAQKLGSANTVCAIDAKRKGTSWVVLVRGGRDDTGIDAIAWAKKAAERGAGELLVTSFDRDGTGEGFDVELLSTIKQVVKVPVIASGGGKSLRSFVDAVKIGRADAVLAASVFHFGALSIADVKNALSAASFPIRP